MSGFTLRRKERRERRHLHSYVSEQALRRDLDPRVRYIYELAARAIDNIRKNPRITGEDKIRLIRQVNAEVQNNIAALTEDGPRTQSSMGEYRPRSP